MSRYVVGGNPYRRHPSFEANTDCLLPHPVWTDKTCEPARDFGYFRLAWGALFARDKTIRAHCLSSPELPSAVRKFFVREVLGFHDYHLRVAIISNTALTGGEAISLGKKQILGRILQNRPELFSLPGVADYYLERDLRKTDWVASVEGLEPAFYERIAEDEKTWPYLASNASAPAAVLRRILHNSRDSADMARVVKNPNCPIEDLICANIYGSYLDEEIADAMEERSGEVVTWLQENHPELLDVPYDWVRQVLAGSVMASQ